MSEITFNDILIKPQYSDVLSRSDVDLTSNMEGLELKLPVVSANMRHITGPKMAVEMGAHGGLGILHRFNDIDVAVEEFNSAIGDLCVKKGERSQKIVRMIGVSVGVKEEDKRRAESLYEAGAKIFCVDVAHGHHVLVKNMVEHLKSYEDICIIAGNIATKEAIRDLEEWGVDIAKVGIGPGAVCMTRKNTGVGVPQFSALQEVSSVSKIPIIADGGIKCVGDIAKALIFADAVMIGSFIAGTSETPGKVFRDEQNKFYKVYGGSASAETKMVNGKDTRFVEGVTKSVPFQGHVKHILREIRQGVQSAFSYTGANTLKEFQSKVKWDVISGSGKEESKL